MFKNIVDLIWTIFRNNLNSIFLFFFSIFRTCPDKLILLLKVLNDLTSFRTFQWNDWKMKSVIYRIVIEMTKFQNNEILKFEKNEIEKF